MAGTAPAVVNDEDRTMRPAHDEPPLGLQLLEAARTDEVRDRNIHGRFAGRVKRLGLSEWSRTKDLSRELYRTLTHTLFS
jgi:hypothetical protein